MSTRRNQPQRGLKRLLKPESEQELGFGKTMTTSTRLLLPNGKFNVERDSLILFENLYDDLITMPLWQFMLFVLLNYLITGCLFALGYYFIGIEHLIGATQGDLLHNFQEAFFFSTQTLTTVGYGRVSPDGFATNLLAALEALIGVLGFALMSGLLYGRFSRPRANIVFSKNMLLSPYKDGKALMFRMANTRKSELTNATAALTLAINEPDAEGNPIRLYHSLPLELSTIAFFTLSWTLVHAKNENSPIYQLDYEDFVNGQAEFLVLISGTDDTTQQTVHARYSYIAEDLIWNARFDPIISHNSIGQPRLHASKIGSYSSVFTT